MVFLDSMELMSTNTSAFDDAPARLLENWIKDFVRTSPDNSLSHIDSSPMFDQPLVGFASGGDPLFDEYKKIIGDFHQTPEEGDSLPPQGMERVERHLLGLAHHSYHQTEQSKREVRSLDEMGSHQGIRRVVQ